MRMCLLLIMLATALVLSSGCPAKKKATTQDKPVAAAKTAVKKEAAADKKTNRKNKSKKKEKKKSDSKKKQTKEKKENKKEEAVSFTGVRESPEELERKAPIRRKPLDDRFYLFSPQGVDFSVEIPRTHRNIEVDKQQLALGGSERDSVLYWTGPYEVIYGVKTIDWPETQNMKDREVRRALHTAVLEMQASGDTDYSQFKETKILDVPALEFHSESRSYEKKRDISGKGFVLAIDGVVYAVSALSFDEKNLSSDEVKHFLDSFKHASAAAQN